MPEAALLAALRQMVPEGAGLGWADAALDHPLMPGESLPGAVPARLREFAAGRTAARMALAAIGAGSVALPKAADRTPVWPAGIIGSITHSGRHCLAVAMLAGQFRGIGIDLEEDGPLDSALWDTILRPEERGEMTGALAKRVFSAKEAAFKAQYPVSRSLFDFDVMRVDLQDTLFTAVFMQAVPPFASGDRIAGRTAHVGGHVLTLAHV
ncbi:4'-phosphopantetheinyl transferase [Pseudotabrizicola sp.]|uniref:4'-phosphopantetheinyl transferase family protein n=1 Tax=Pseudotabrizicola sp. TaxID=2939647 RepID=UPI00271FBA9F|nr:4'-phosphopantetheinyl transferase superfamily protein [Pseudotabrizicola sp.]MDO8883775.1 4'-phosphopantetheinyl transferase superfamily protein [Pseudotabrizicola sp.]